MLRGFQPRFQPTGFQPVVIEFLFFGYVVGIEPELGYFSLRELETCKQGLTGILALPVERDLYFEPCRLSEVKKKHGIE